MAETRYGYPWKGMVSGGGDSTSQTRGKNAGPETFTDGGYPDMMGKPQPAHIGSQSSAPGKEDPIGERGSGYSSY